MSLTNLTITGRIKMLTQNGPSQGHPALTVMSINIEGLYSPKEIVLSELCAEWKCDVLCIQETHRDINDNRPKINGMRIALELPHKKYGSAIFTKPNLVIKSVGSSQVNNIEIITIELTNCSITSVYKPPTQPYEFINPENFKRDTSNIVIGDFNSHSVSWGYTETNEDGQKLEAWSEAENLTLIHDPKLPHSFNSGRWKKGYNPDLIFVSNNIIQQSSKYIGQPIPNTQHRPVCLQTHAVIRAQSVPFKRRFNYKKARWKEFTEALENKIQQIDPTLSNYDKFVNLVKETSRKHIPRGCRS